MSKIIQYFTNDENGKSIKSNKLLIDGRWRNSRIMEEALQSAQPHHIEFQIIRNGQPETNIQNIEETKQSLKSLT